MQVDLSRPEVVEECNYDRFQVRQLRRNFLSPRYLLAPVSARAHESFARHPREHWLSCAAAVYSGTVSSVWTKPASHAFQVQYVPLPDGMAYDGSLYKQMPGLVRDIKLNVSVVRSPRRALARHRPKSRPPVAGFQWGI